MYTRKKPFSHIHYYAHVIYDVVRGHRPRLPSAETAPQLTAEVWKVLQMCWNQIPGSRPSMRYVSYLLSTQEQMEELGVAA